MEKKKCMIKVVTRDELEQIRNTFPFVNTAYLSEGCPHCQNVKPLLEEECSKVKELTPTEVVPTIHCPVEEDFCREELRDMEVKGIPYITGTPRGEKKVFAIEGANERVIKDTYETLRGMIKATKNKMEEEGDK